MLNKSIQPVDKPIQRAKSRFGIGIASVEVDALVKASEARARFDLSGSNLCVAVLDTGINVDHVDFRGRIVAQANFTSDNGGNSDNASDGHGHGANVSGIVAANGDHIGVAPEANVLPVKVLDNTGNGNFRSIDDGLQWVIDNREAYNISVACMSLGGRENFQDDSILGDDEIRRKIRKLNGANVAVVVAAGNNFYLHRSQEGMSYPAIIRECVSVGAVYDNVEGSFRYGGAIAYSTAPDRITPFSQRLHFTKNEFCNTDIFAPGAPVTSTGIDGPNGESTQHGTSQAAPVVCGALLLLQEFYIRATGSLPTVAELIRWIRISGEKIYDGDDEKDNVENTNKSYKRLDVLRACSLVKRELEVAEIFVNAPSENSA